MAAWIDFDKIKREADFAEVLRHYGFEFPDGRNQLKLPCPFHEEGRASLSVNLEGKVFHCFGCGAKGNVVEFVQRMEKRAGKPIGTRQAMLRLAEICGIAEVETERPRIGTRNGAQRRVHARSGAETVERPSELSSRAPEAPTGPQGHAAELDADAEATEINPPLAFTLKLDPSHSYMSERGVPPELIDEFGLGFCSRGLMKGRVCIPIHNEHGELVAYAGRWVGPDVTIPEGEGRYKLPPRFEKSRVLFNLHRVPDPHHLVIVEGFFGAMRLHEWMVNVVSLMGRALSEHQLELLREAGTRYLTLLLDGDEPGRQAMAEIMKRLATTELRVRAIMLPEGTQPDTVGYDWMMELLDFYGVWSSSLKHALP